MVSSLIHVSGEAKSIHVHDRRIYAMGKNELCSKAIGGLVVGDATAFGKSGVWHQSLETLWTLFHLYQAPKLEKPISSKSQGAKLSSIHATRIVSRYVKVGAATLNDPFLDVHSGGPQILYGSHIGEVRIQ